MPGYVFLKNQIWLMPDGKRILLVEEKIKSGDSTWLGVVIPLNQKENLLPAKSERVAVMSRFLRGCKLVGMFAPERQLT